MVIPSSVKLRELQHGIDLFKGDVSYSPTAYVTSYNVFMSS